MVEVESEEFLEQSDYEEENIKNIFLNKNECSTSEDPIPHLLNPQKETPNKLTSIPYLISNPGIHINADRIKNVAKSKISLYIINQNLQKYNSTPEYKESIIINNLIISKETHFTSIFKDLLISDYNEEFLRGFFTFNETKEVLPKFYEYYKNYLVFFCKGTFRNFKINDIIQECGERHAEIYYNRNYLNKERTKKKEKKENIDENNIENNDKNEILTLGDTKIPLSSFFTKSIENSIKNIINSHDSKLYTRENENELSNIKPSKENTIHLPDNSSVSNDDVITKKSSIVNIIDLMNNKRKKNNSKMKNKKKRTDIILIDNKKFKKTKNIFNNKKNISSFSKTS